MYLKRTPRCLIGISGLACLTATAFITPIGLYTEVGISKPAPEYRPAQPYQPQPRPVPNAPLYQVFVSISNDYEGFKTPLSLKRGTEKLPIFFPSALLFCLCPVSTARFERDPVHKPPWTSLVC